MVGCLRLLNQDFYDSIKIYIMIQYKHTDYVLLIMCWILLTFVLSDKVPIWLFLTARKIYIIWGELAQKSFWNITLITWTNRLVSSSCFLFHWRIFLKAVTLYLCSCTYIPRVTGGLLFIDFCWELDRSHESIFCFIK